MSMISDHLKAEIIDPTLPRDSFVPPDHAGDDDLFDDGYTPDVGDAGDDDVE